MPKYLYRLAVSSLLSVTAAICQTPSSAAGHVDFDRQVRPIFSDKCYPCHGPDETHRMAKLRFDMKDGGAFAEHGGYIIVKPGDSANSRLYQRVSSDKKSFQMPPASTGQALTPAQIEIIKKWIDEGAHWETHWAYAVPQRPEIPKVSNPAWVRNPIDSFVLANLDKNGLKPSGEADRAILLRRVTFDLTGLPPTPAEVEAFLADKSPDAYEKVVDRLLLSPRYGERMAMQWLDLARYADTHGYHIDSHREMWHWRDWVINAFNQNMPFSQFTIEQLAGDLLPDATVSQKIASGFNRNHMINFEGGAIPEEYQNEYVVDRVEATAATWMGVTLGCARCHDHKYDPLSQKEFYRFYAFFNNVSEEGLDGKRGNAHPFLQLPSEEQQAKLDQLTKAITELDKTLDEKKVGPIQTQWEQTRLATLVAPTRLGMVVHYEFDGSLSDSSGKYRYGHVVKGDIGYPAGIVNRSASFDGETHVTLDDAGTLSHGPFSTSFWIQPDGNRPITVLTEVSDATNRAGVELYLDDFLLTDIQHWEPRLYVRLSRKWPSDAIEIRTKDHINPSGWRQVVVNYDGSGKAAGLHVFFDGKPEEVEVLKNSLTGKITSTAKLEIGNKDLGKAFKGELDDLRIYSRPLTAAEIQPLVVDEPVRASIMIPPDHRDGGQKERLQSYYLSTEASPELRAAFTSRKDLRKEKTELVKVIPTTMVMAELEKPRETAILGRGDYRNRGEKVTPGVPAILPPLPAGAPANRLTLAKWMVSPDNPLTSRVVVNRYWQSYFGIGIVKTPQDFGSQGDAPSNQALLDWMATEFIRNGWDVRAMQRLIVTSATYRQDSAASPDLIKDDPENRLLARGPRFRLPAEAVRDNALFVSGLLKERVGGPSVFPYQPKGPWEDIAFGDGFSAQSYVPSHGDDLYRRSMYTFWKRTSPPPSLSTFDAPDREKCTARRLMTNTPLQALVLLNDPTYIEASRALAGRMILEGGSDPAKRISYAFELAMARPPAPHEVEVLRSLEEKELAEYRQDPASARKLIAVGESKPPANIDPVEMAAWTTVASAILNLDETITKE
jgi:Protein of unknown function (DUF1553)/Protein of unknown function (DUF1549)/Concanavalin A-like lectin/glucanases superfamily/Planctomycete cytochrome C